MKTQLRILLFSIIPILSFSQDAHEWDGSFSKKWNNPFNWVDNSIPSTHDSILIPAGLPRYPIFPGSDTFRFVEIEGGASITIDSLSEFYVRNPNGTACLSNGSFYNHGCTYLKGPVSGLRANDTGSALFNYGDLFAESIHNDAIRQGHVYNSRSSLLCVSSDSANGVYASDTLLNEGNLLVDSCGAIGVFSGWWGKNESCASMVIQNTDVGMETIRTFVNQGDIFIIGANKGLRHENDGYSGKKFTNGENDLIYLCPIYEDAFFVDNLTNYGIISLCSDSGVTALRLDSAAILDSYGRILNSGNWSSPLNVDDSATLYVEEYYKSERYTDSIIWKIGRNEYYMVVDSFIRNFIIYIPEFITADMEVPLVFMFHGGGGTGNKFYNISTWNERADQDSFIVIYPTGLTYHVKDDECKTKWLDWAAFEKIEEYESPAGDVEFISELIFQSKRDLPVDTNRFYGCGFSNGSGMVRDRLLLELNEHFAALAGFGSFGLVTDTVVENMNYLSYWNFWGTDDPKLKNNLNWVGDLPKCADGIFMIDEMKSRLFNLATTLQLETFYTEDFCVDSIYSLIRFDQNLGGTDNEYRVSVIQDLLHKFPNGTNNPEGFNGPDKVWPWFSQFSKD